MKKLLLPTVALMMASCGGEDICSCIEAEKEMNEKLAVADADKEAIEAEYKNQKEACEKLMDETVKEIEALPEEEQKTAGEAMYKEMEECGKE